jgi:hypothetical protein
MGRLGHRHFVAHPFFWISRSCLNGDIVGWSNRAVLLFVWFIGLFPEAEVMLGSPRIYCEILFLFFRFLFGSDANAVTIRSQDRSDRNPNINLGFPGRSDFNAVEPPHGTFSDPTYWQLTSSPRRSSPRRVCSTFPWSAGRDGGRSKMNQSLLDWSARQRIVLQSANFFKSSQTATAPWSGLRSILWLTDYCIVINTQSEPAK